MPISNRLPYESKLSKLHNDKISVSINCLRGGDVLSFMDEVSETEILWQSKTARKAQPLSASLAQDAHSFYDQYPGGIQELFPNTADSTRVNGVDLPFHGEACRIPWEIVNSSGNELRISAQLRRLPIAMERVLSVDKTNPVLSISSKITNQSATEFPYSWGFHPAFGSALLSEHATLYVPGDFYTVHPENFSSNQKLVPGSEHAIEQKLNCGVLPLRSGKDFGADLLYIKCLDGWLIARNEKSGLTISITWDIEKMPFIWVWREFFNPTGFPWWGQENIVGLEPHSSAPAQELRLLEEKGLAMNLGANESITAELSISLTYTDVSKQPIGINESNMPILEGINK
jgi:galactose mutarotase-like enzyme